MGTGGWRLIAAGFTESGGCIESHNGMCRESKLKGTYEPPGVGKWLGNKEYAVGESQWLKEWMVGCEGGYL